MRGKTGFCILIIVSITVFSNTPAVSAETDLSINAAEYISIKAKENKKTRLAVYAFTTETGDISPETKGCSTKIMGLLLEKKDFKVIDPESIPAVITEQEKGLTGLVDAETAAETGKMTGADALIFGIYGKNSLQIRLIDSATGEVIGASIEQDKGKTKINNQEFSSTDAKRRFQISQLEINLRKIYNKNPLRYLFITATDKELEELYQTFPVRMKNIIQKDTEKDPDKKALFEKRKRKLLQLREEDPSFNNRMIESRNNLLEKLKEKKRKDI